MTINSTNIKKTTGTCAKKCKIAAKTKQKGVFNGTTGQRIKAHRGKLGMTQQGLADKLHINRTALSLIETDKRPATLEQLKIFSKEFNVSINYLSCQTDSQASNTEYIEKSSLIEEERLSLVNDLFKKQAILYADEYLSKLSPESQEDLAIHIYKLLSPKGK
ncbi:helix-turn-helix domain-containing protein [Lacrimispora sp. AGF001]|uniref:helix-turn-helix domain-containing protein n=1 Tax=Lacrimispora sp. AGF001 TaxID=3401631 RepID=UPI003B428BE2